MKLKIDDGVEVINESAFKGNAAIESVEIPASVSKIGAEAFKGCQNLSSVIIAEGSVSLEIGERAFEGCKSLKSITLPGRCNRFLDACFKDSGLENISIGLDGDFIQKGFQLFSGCPSAEELGKILEQARLDRLQRLNFSTKASQNTPTNAVLDGLRAAMPRVQQNSEEMRQGLEAIYGLVQRDTEFGFEEYCKKYKESCEYFQGVEDWSSAKKEEIKNVLMGTRILRIADLNFGEINEGEWNNIENNLDLMRKICVYIKGLQGTAAEQAKLLEYKEWFCGQFNRTHHAAFYRIVAALRPDLVVNIPDAAKLAPVFAWLMDEALSRGDISDWYKMALGVRQRLHELLPEKTVYQIGVFSWYIADAFRDRKDPNEKQKNCKQKVLNSMRENGLLGD